jgi:hypothetical protein
VHLLSLEAQDDVEWLGELDELNALTRQVILTCDGGNGPAKFDGHPAIILVTDKRTGANPLLDLYGQMGAVHYTVYVKLMAPFKAFIPFVRR